MFRITASESAQRAKAYYTEKARQDYYLQGQEMLGEWGGKGAKRLGLNGTISADHFRALCDNINPDTGTSLTQRTAKNRIPGYDLNFHCPKSVSVVYAWNGDKRILQAFRQAVRETMEELEQRVQTRVRKGGQDFNRETGNLIWAEFVHLTARPEGKLPDPHLHAHCYTFNATFDEVENQWKAAEVSEIYTNAPYYQATFFSRLSNNLMAIGYAVRPVDKAFEITGVPDEVIGQFSKRTVKIKETAAKLGITDPVMLDKLGALTRKAKSSELSFTELRGFWRTEVSEENQRTLDKFRRPKLHVSLGHHPLMQVESEAETQAKAAEVPNIRPKPSSALVLLGGEDKAPAKSDRKMDPSLAKRALDRSILHNFYRASVVTEEEIITHALRLSYGTGLTPDGLREAMRQHPEFIFGKLKGKRLVTTHGVLAEEKVAIEWVKAGMETREPLNADYQIKDQRLNDEQQAAVLHVLKSRDRVTAIEGKSGTGKTWLMREAVAAIEAEHVPVLVLAPTTPAVQQTLRKGGFPDAQTVEQLLVNQKLQEKYRGGVWWVDEAGMLSGRSMARLFALADKMGARIVTSGDVGQHRAVERGDALRMLYTHAELKPALVTKIMRQQGDYKEWIELLAQGEVAEAFRKMDAAGVIHEMPERTRHKALAKRYLDLWAEGERPGIVAPTHLEGKMVTDKVRDAMKQMGKLEGEDTPVLRLKQIDLSPGDKADWRSYRPGWVVEYIQATEGTPAGTRRVIDSIDYENGLVLMKVPVGGTQTATRNLDLSEYADRLVVYEADELAIAPGEHILITKNGHTEYTRDRVYRGSEHVFTGFDEHGDLKFDDGMVLKRDFGHLAYAYTSTSHGAQSKTVKHVLVAQGAVSLPASNMEQFYVSTSRGKEAMEMFTGHKEALLDAIMNTSQRHFALELTETDPELYREPPEHGADLREAQERAEEMMKADERKKLRRALSRELGEHETPVETPRKEMEEPVQRPQRETKRPKKRSPRMREKLGGRTQLPEPEKPEWKLPVIPLQGPEPLKEQLGQQPELPTKLEWKLPVAPPPPPAQQPEMEDEDLEPDMDDGYQPELLP